MSAFKKNTRKVIDFKTGMGIAQHEMLKKLLNESGLGRNEWHKRAQKIVGIARSLGSMNKLSDIFNGQSRSLPMRDIVPYIQALGLNKKEEGHYIAEFLKAHCDENLHQYIRSSSNAKDVGINIRVDVLLEQISGLRNELARMRYVTIPANDNYQANKLKYELEVYKNAYNHSHGLLLELYSSVFQNEKLRDDFGEEVFDLIFDAGPPLEVEISWKHQELEPKLEEEYMEYSVTYVEKSITYELKSWFLMFQLILQRNSNPQFLAYLALFIPEDAISSLEHFLRQWVGRDDDEPLYKHDNSLPPIRSNREVMMHLLSDFKSEFPEEFEKDLQHYVEYREYGPSKMAELHVITDFELPESGDNSISEGEPKLDKDLEPITFEKYVARRMRVLKNLPLDSNFLDLKVRKYIPEEYAHYLKLKSKGVLERNSIAELYQLSSPSISPTKLQQTQVISSLVNKIVTAIDVMSRNCGISNPIQKYLDHENYPLNFKEYDCFGIIDDSLQPYHQAMMLLSIDSTKT